MTHLFVQDDSNRWTVLPLTNDVYRLSLPDPQQAARRAAQASSPAARSPVVESTRIGRITRKGALLLKRNGAEAQASLADWTLLTGTGTRLRLNGVAIAIGIATLRHRDELRLNGSLPLYFSTERLVRVETYRADDSPRCPRCTLPVELGDPSVCCPACRVLHHQHPERECWTYTESCALCDQRSDLAAGYRWSPEGL